MALPEANSETAVPSHPRRILMDLRASLVDWIRDLQPEGDLLDLLLQTLRADNPDSAEQPAGRRNELLDQSYNRMLWMALRG